MHCECGGRMHGKGAVTGGTWYGGYLCGAHRLHHEQRTYLSAKRVEPAVEQWLLTFDVPAAPGVRHRTDRDRINREINALQGELTELTRQLGRGIIPEVAYTSAADEITDAISTHERALRALPTPTAPTAVELRSLRTGWDRMTIQEKNLAVRQLVTRIDILDDGAAVRIRTAWGKPITLPTIGQK